MNIMNSITNKKHEGFALILALIVVGVGLILIAAMFSTVTTFTRFFSEYRQAYDNTIIARNYIEMMKGEIVAENISRGGAGVGVLHGKENQDEAFPENAITNLDGLIIYDGVNPERFAFSADVNLNGPQIVEVNVYDANYRVEGINSATFPIADLHELPPSFYIEGGSGPEWEDIGKDGSDYNEFEEPYVGFSGAFSNYGAYLIRVRIYDTANSTHGNPERLVRTTEEAFLQVIP